MREKDKQTPNSRSGKEFSDGTRRQVYKEQKGKCDACGVDHKPQSGNGPLTLHHCVPIVQGGSKSRDNAVGVCRTPCHDELDKLAKEGKYYPQVKKDPAFQNVIYRAQQQKGI